MAERKQILFRPSIPVPDNAGGGNVLKIYLKAFPNGKAFFMVFNELSFYKCIKQRI